MSVSDPYKVLQVDPEAEYEVIVAAYRRLARKYHPDVSPDPESHEKMIAINQAWEQLRDPVRRAALDRARLRSAAGLAWVAAADAHLRTAAASSESAARSQTPRSARPMGAPGAAGGSGQPSWPFGLDESGSSDAGPTTGNAPRPGQPWTDGRVPIGGYASGASSRPEGAAGPPPGNPSGSVLSFGRYAGWSLGEIARTEIDYLEWLDRMPIGRIYQAEIDELLRAKGRRSAGAPADQGRGGPFRRR